MRLRTIAHRIPLVFGLLLAASSSVMVGCAGAHIPNTTVEDNAQNREIVRFVEEYRHAVERIDVAGLLNLASPSYYDDNGTPVGGDDIDYDTLRDKLAIWPENLVDVRYEIRYRDVEALPDRIHVVYRYTASFRVHTAEGEEQWIRRLGDNRLVLTRNDHGDYRIVSGM